jgi:hypothetical protein
MDQWVFRKLLSIMAKYSDVSNSPLQRKAIKCSATNPYDWLGSFGCEPLVNKQKNESRIVL